jgi:hypothetical protein
VDVSGFYDNWGLLTVSLGYGAFVAAVGGAIGLWMKRRNGRTPAITDTPQAAPAAPLEPYISDPAQPPPPTGPAPPMGHI